MKLNKINIYSIAMMLLVSAVLAITVVDLIGQKKENLETMCQLNDKVKRLQVEVERNLQKKSVTPQDIALFQFKANVFQSKYPIQSDITDIVFRKSQQYGFSPYLVMAIIQVESNFNPRAVSSAGAYGLMQVKYSVWKDALHINFNRIFEKEYNIDLGLKVLKHYYEKEAGNMIMALFRYNNGFNYNNIQFNGKITSTCFAVPVHDVKVKEVPRVVDAVDISI